LARRGEEGGGEDRELRLESDRDAVRILTMHAVKGLEFPVVFCPSLWHSLAGKNFAGSGSLAACHDGGKAVLDLGSEEFDRARGLANDEERAEELRLLYVALTRAKLQFVVFWPLVAGGPQAEAISRSPLCYLLAGDNAGPLSDETMRQKFLERGRAEDVSAEEAARDGEGKPPIPLQQKNTDNTAGQTFAARKFHGQFDWSWQVASFSSLARRQDESDTPPAPAAGTDEENQSQDEVEKIALPALPKGSGFGQLVHACLDKMDFAAPEEELLTLAKSLIEQQAALFGFTESGANIARLVANTLTTSLPAIGEKAPGGWRLANLAAGDMVKEMPWSFALKKIRPEEISAILKDDPSVRPLSGLPAAGYLTGFIDLFCQYQGKYYIIDYKSNFLGDRQADYAAGALLQAMAEHNYGLQYWLYTLAADRWLAWQRPDYNYERHFGGVYYLFVRGMRPDIAGSGVFATRPELNTLKRLAELLGDAR
jgi:exodeoxyribonuclease V beta subunit